MYRDDYLANAIYERARAWTRASFFLARLGEDRTAPVYFTNGFILDGPLKDTNMLLCDLTERGELQLHMEVLTFSSRSFKRPEESILGWMYISGTIDKEKSGVAVLEDHTEGIQLQLNRLRRREELMRIGLSRQSWRVSPLFRPDHEQIHRVTGVPPSTVRAFFDGKVVSNEARDKILFAFNATAEEMEGKLWDSRS